MLYRGESENNVEGGEWWTTSEEKAKRFGKVQKFTVRSEDIGRYAHRGHGGADEFVFADLGKRPPQLAQAERVASRSISEDVATEVQTSTQAATQATNEEVTQTVVPAEVKREPEPDVISDIEAPDDTPARAVERAKAPNKRNLVIDGFNQRDTVLNRNENFASKFLERDNLVPVVEKVMNKTSHK